MTKIQKTTALIFFNKFILSMENMIESASDAAVESEDLKVPVVEKERESKLNLTFLPLLLWKTTQICQWSQSKQS